MPEVILESFAAKLQALSDKYIITLSNVEDEIIKTETILSTMIDHLTGSEADIEGLAELKALFGGE